MSNQRLQYSNQNTDDWPTKLLYVSKASYDTDWHSTNHIHPFTEVFFVMGGEGLFYLNDEVFPVKKGDAILVHPYTLHTEEGLKGRTLEYIVIGLDHISFMHPKDQPKSSYRFTIQPYEIEITHALTTMVHELEEQHPYYQKITNAHLESLLSYILRITNCTLEQQETLTSNLECSFVKKYITDHYSTDITLDLLSELTYMNKFYLAHSFKETYGVSPIQYLLNKRISEACTLLSTTNYSISTIASIVGFSSPSYFAQAMNNKLGCSPRKYRQQLLHKETL